MPISLKKKLLVLSSIIMLISQVHAQKLGRKDSVIHLAQKVADWQLKVWKQSGTPHPKSDWTMGACYTGYLDLAEVTTYSTYFNDMLAIGDSLHWNTGPRHTMADDYCVAQMFGQLYTVYNKPQMIAQWKRQADSIIDLPHTETLEWKNNIAEREWAWCDALFMGPPSLAYLSTATGDRKYLDAACKLWWKTTTYLYDKDEHLYYRDSRFFTQREANGKKVFWSRGNGWVLAGLVRMLKNMPEDFPERPAFIKLYQEMAAKIGSLQNADGTWHAALLDPAAYPVKEASGTGFYCYALAYGINNGLLPYRQYHTIVEKAWKALAACVQNNGKLGYVQQIGEKPEKVSADDTEVYGVGALLLAGSEVYRMFEKH